MEGMEGMEKMSVNRFATADSKVKGNTCQPQKVSRLKHHPAGHRNASLETV